MLTALLLAVGFIAGALWASRSYGTDFESVLDRSANSAATAAGQYREEFGRLPSSLPDLPRGDRYRDIDRSMIEYCSQHAFGEQCIQREAWDEEYGPFELQIPFGLIHCFVPWSPQDNVPLLLQFGLLAGLLALTQSALRRGRRR